MVPLSRIEPDPDQPRQQLGDLEELTASIRTKGVLEPILARPLPLGDPVEAPHRRYRIISGERRFRAAHRAGVSEIPLIEMDVSRSEALEIALVENLQHDLFLDQPHIDAVARPQRLLLAILFLDLLVDLLAEALLVEGIVPIQPPANGLGTGEVGRQRLLQPGLLRSGALCSPVGERLYPAASPRGTVHAARERSVS